jgi:hypothetical protein
MRNVRIMATFTSYLWTRFHVKLLEELEAHISVAVIFSLHISTRKIIERFLPSAKGPHFVGPRLNTRADGSQCMRDVAGPAKAFRYEVAQPSSPLFSAVPGQK